MDYHALEAELERYFDQLQALSELKELDRNIAQCLDNAATYLEGALEIAREKNSPLPPLLSQWGAKSKRFGIYRWIATNTEPEEAIDLILALEDSSTPIAGE